MPNFDNIQSLFQYIDEHPINGNCTFMVGEKPVTIGVSVGHPGYVSGKDARLDSDTLGEF